MKERKMPKMKDFIKDGCSCGHKHGAWLVIGPEFCKWECSKCRKETAVEWDDK